MTCPICRHVVAPRRENAAFPFCGERCRLIDLGHWLGESYRVPEPDEVEADEADAGDPTPEASSLSVRRDTRTS